MESHEALEAEILNVSTGYSLVALSLKSPLHEGQELNSI